MSTNLNRFSSQEDKKRQADVIFDELGDYFFDRINLITHPYSEVIATVGGYTSTTVFGGESRLTDTAEGKLFKPDRRARMRCHFYLENPDACIGYILSPAIYDSFASLNTLSTMNSLRAYVGLKFDRGVVYVAIKEAGGAEKLFTTGLTLSGSGATTTYVLDIIYGVKSTRIEIDSSYVGEYSSDLIGTFNTTKTFLSLFSPAKSSDGTGVNIVIENYQFLQDK